MNIEQRQNLLDAIVEFKKADFYSAFKNKYSNEENIDALIFADYSVSELISLAERAVSQLEDILQTNIWKVLPSDNINLSIYGTITLNNNIYNITQRLLNANYKDAALSVKAQICYQMQYGVWEKTNFLNTKNRESNLDRFETEIQLTNSLISAKLKNVNLLIKELEAKELEIKDLIKTKQHEFEELRNNQLASNSILNDIENTKNNVLNNQELIETLNKKADSIVLELESTQKHFQAQIQTNEEVLSQSQKSLEDFNLKSDRQIKQISSDYESVSNNAEEVRKMMGYIANGTLSHSFNKRKLNLEKQIKICLWSIGIISVLAVIWVCIVFFCLSANTGNEWANILINGIKSSPLFFLLGFAISQYQKERNLLEEYAFRESVAVTLTAYIEQMPNKEDEDKRKLLISTVEQLYAKPVITNKEQVKFDSKDLSDTSKILKTLVETLSNNK